MLKKQQKAFLLGLFCFFIWYPSKSECWLFDRGLEKEVQAMKDLFKKGDLFRLYCEYVDPILRVEIENNVSRVASDKKNGPEIARRLRFPDYESLRKARPRDIVEHYFLAMKKPPKKKAQLVENIWYLKTAYILTMTLAPFDDGMQIVKRKINSERAQLFFEGNNMKVIAHFVRRNGKWYITNKGF